MSFSILPFLLLVGISLFVSTGHGCNHPFNLTYANFTVGFREYQQNDPNIAGNASIFQSRTNPITNTQQMYTLNVKGFWETTQSDYQPDAGSAQTVWTCVDQNWGAPPGEGYLYEPTYVPPGSPAQSYASIQIPIATPSSSQVAQAAGATYITTNFTFSLTGYSFLNPQASFVLAFTILATDPVSGVDSAIEIASINDNFAQFGEGYLTSADTIAFGGQSMANLGKPKMIIGEMVSNFPDSASDIYLVIPNFGSQLMVSNVALGFTSNPPPSSSPSLQPSRVPGTSMSPNNTPQGQGLPTAWVILIVVSAVTVAATITIILVVLAWTRRSSRYTSI